MHQSFSLKMDEDFMYKYKRLTHKDKKIFIKKTRQYLKQTIEGNSLDNVNQTIRKMNEETIREHIAITKKNYQNQMNYFENQLQHITRSYKKDKPGFCYIITDDNFLMTNHYKIGMTTDLKNRLSQLQTSTPYIISKVIILECDNPQDIEQELHERYAEKRIRGEWYQLSKKDLEEIRADYSQWVTEINI